jgi:hypothetical protein
MLAKVKRFRIIMGWVAASIGLLLLVVWFGNSVLIALETSDPSRSIGTPAHGRLQNGRRLPTSGANFKAYSRVGALLGRNSVHQIVRAVVSDACCPSQKPPKLDIRLRGDRVATWRTVSASSNLSERIVCGLHGSCT